MIGKLLISTIYALAYLSSSFSETICFPWTINIIAALQEEREFVISTKGGITVAHVTIHESPTLTLAMFYYEK